MYSHLTGERIGDSTSGPKPLDGFIWLQPVHIYIYIYRHDIGNVVLVVLFVIKDEVYFPIMPKNSETMRSYEMMKSERYQVDFWKSGGGWGW